MTRFNIVVARCDRYEAEAADKETALKMIKNAHYYGDLKHELERVDFFTKSEGEIEKEQV